MPSRYIMQGEIAMRETADGKRIVLYADGGVTDGRGYSLPGVGISRSKHNQALDLRAGWGLMQWAEMLTLAEVPVALQALRAKYKTMDKQGLPHFAKLFADHHRRIIVEALQAP